MLVIDAGNSSVKFARVARRHASPRMLATVAAAQLAASRVEAIVRRSGCTSVAASCVVPAIRKVLRAGCPSLAFVGKSSPLNFPTVVDRSTVGADRLANMAEAVRRFGSSVIVADFGTAATFDLLDARGGFAGGAIAPGWRVLAQSLVTNTAQLPDVDATAPENFSGRNTREALRAGVVGGYAGMVKHLLGQLPAKHVVFTGGDAEWVAKITGRPALIDPLWTLKGVSVLGDLAAREASK